MMLYLLDANVLITAHNTYYPVNKVPEFWDWLLHFANAGSIKMPRETYNEVRGNSGDAQRDLLFDWVTRRENKDALILDEEVKQPLVVRVLRDGYGPMDEAQIESRGRDPLLIAYALASPADRCVVTNETRGPSRAPQNRKIPDACERLGIEWCTPFKVTQTFDFSTSWRAP